MISRQIFLLLTLLLLIAFLLGCGGHEPTVPPPTATPITYPATWTPAPTSADSTPVTPTVTLKPSATLLPAEKLPPSHLITNLVPFTIDKLGITGMRPDNWRIFSGDTSFQISSDAAAPDGFSAHIITADKYQADGAINYARNVLELFEKNDTDGPDPVVLEQSYTPDGGGYILAQVTSFAQDTNIPIRFTRYARVTVLPTGMLVSVALVPTKLYSAESSFVRQMVDSVKLVSS